MMSAGYSGTPLWKKLGLKEFMTACVYRPPDGYYGWLDEGPTVFWGKARADVWFTHIFSKERAQLERDLAEGLSNMARDGMIWVSWPKQTAKVETDITEDTIRAICLPMGLVDVKVCAVDATWSGLKLVIRKELR